MKALCSAARGLFSTEILEVGISVLTTPASSTGQLWTSGFDSWGAIQLSFWDVSLLLHLWYMPAFTHHSLILQCFLHSRPNLFISLVPFCDYIFCCAVEKSSPVDLFFFPGCCCHCFSMAMLTYTSSALLLPRLLCPSIFLSLSEEGVYRI